MNIPLKQPFPEMIVVIQGPHKGPNCRVAIYSLVDFKEDVTCRKAESWASKYGVKARRKSYAKRNSVHNDDSMPIAVQG